MNTALIYTAPTKIDLSNVTDPTELLKQLPHGTVINEEGPMMPQQMREELLVIFDESIAQIRSNLHKKGRKIKRSFDRSSLKVWEYSPHQTLRNSMEYLFEQMDQLREHIKRGSYAGVILLAPVIRENWTYSFNRVDQELKEPEYNYRNEREKARARQHHIAMWKQRKQQGR